MKKLFLLGVSLSTLSFATSIRSVSVELIDTPMMISGVGSKAQIVRATFDGVVYGAECAMKRPYYGGHGRRPVPGTPSIDYSRCQWSTIKQLSRYEIREVARLVRAAEHGALVTQTGPHCLALPMRSFTIRANNNQFLLQSGSYPCGGTVTNNTRAAAQLIAMVKEWKQDVCH